MKTVKGYSKIQSKNKIFGLDFFDLLLLLGIYLFVFVFSTHLLVNIAVVLAAYLFLRLYKKGKAPHWTGSVVRFLFRSKTYSTRLERREDLINK